MANILIVSGSYFPYASANAICMKEFERAMIARGDRVVYAIRKHDIDIPDITIDGKVKIYHVERSVDLFFAECEKIKKMDLPQPIHVLFKCTLWGIKVVSTLYSRLRYGSLRNLAEEKYLKKYADTINEIVENECIDTIISVSMPFLSHKAVARYMSGQKGRKIKWITYMIDAYSQKYGVCDKKKIEEELEIIQLSDKVIFLSVLKESYMKAPFIQYQNKFQFIPLPLLNVSQETDGKKRNLFNKKKKNFVFAGTLYDDTSSLDYFVDFLNKIDSNEFVFHFIGKMYARNLELLQNLKQACRAEIIIYGFKPFEFAENAIEQADVVLNFGNLSPNQIPSKIYKYIIKKKAILTFYKIDEDPSLPMLKKYPLALNIKENTIVENLDVCRFNAFLADVPNKKISNDDLKMIYRGDTSEDICKIFLDNI